MLQKMQKKVEAEGEKEKELFEKYMCYCKTSGGALTTSIADATTKVPELESDIKEGEAKKAQLDEDIKQHQVDRSAAKTAMADATALREKEAAAYEKESSEDSANIAAVAKATAAIEKGMGSAFLQTPTANVLRRVAEKRQEEELVSFLSSTDSYAPASGEITGILKTMHDEMAKDIADEVAAEVAAVKAYGSGKGIFGLGGADKHGADAEQSTQQQQRQQQQAKAGRCDTSSPSTSGEPSPSASACAPSARHRSTLRSEVIFLWIL